MTNKINKNVLSSMFETAAEHIIASHLFLFKLWCPARICYSPLYSPMHEHVIIAHKSTSIQTMAG